MTSPTGTIHDQLAAAVRRVAVLRAHAERVNATYDEARARFDAEYAGEMEAVNAAKAFVAEAEATAKALAEAHYNVTGEKKPVWGLAVQERTRYDYDAGRALAWARQAGMCLIPESLDVKAFAKVAAAIDLPFVTKTVTPLAPPASDLSGLPTPTETPA